MKSKIEQQKFHSYEEKTKNGQLQSPQTRTESTSADPANTCDLCGEAMDEYLDCPESESGKHISIASAKRFMDRLRVMAAARLARPVGKISPRLP